MHLTYKRSLLTRSAPTMVLLGLIFLASVIWPTARFAGSIFLIIAILCVPACFYGAYIFLRLARGGPALTAAPDGLWVGTSRGQRHHAWRDIASVGRKVQTLYVKKRVPVPVIEIVLREAGGSGRGAKPIRVSIGILNEGEAGADRWIEGARRRLDLDALQAA